jgi:hypothetical protein
VDAGLQLVVGVHTENLEYVDEWRAVAGRALRSVPGGADRRRAEGNGTAAMQVRDHRDDDRLRFSHTAPV